MTHVPWCMPGSLTSGFLWSRCQGKRSRYSRRMRNPQFYISGKRPMEMASQITSVTIVYSTLYSMCRSKKTSRLCVTGLCEGNSPVTSEFPVQRAVTQKVFPFDDVIIFINREGNPCLSFPNSPSNHGGVMRIVDIAQYLCYKISCSWPSLV